MYTTEQLKRFPFFARILGENPPDAILDLLTGVVSRAYILEFARSLLAEQIPFTFCLLDLDNFKFINDTYGHVAGDAVLIKVAESLAARLEGYGVVGRFGGDEILLINLRDRTYPEKKEFLNSLYTDGTVLRKNISLEDCEPFVTATLGCATYPDDAGDFDELFALIDKTLYRGKTKGRNCYIIYVEEKHRDIEIQRIARHGVYTTMHTMIRQFELVPGLKNKLQSVMPLLMEELRISELYYAGRSGTLRAVRNAETEEDVSDLPLLMNDDLYTANDISRLKQKCPVFHRAMEKLEIETLLAVRVGMDMETYGYLLCAEPRSRRIWQEEDCAILYFLAKLLAARILLEREDLDGI